MKNHNHTQLQDHICTFVSNAFESKQNQNQIKKKSYFEFSSKRNKVHEKENIKSPKKRNTGLFRIQHGENRVKDRNEEKEKKKYTLIM